MKVLVADYGLNAWYGDIHDYEERPEMQKAMGYDGLERLHAKTEAEALYTSALGNRPGMSFATCEGGSASESILWSSALGKKYVWVNNNAEDFHTFCRQANAQIAAAGGNPLEIIDMFFDRIVMVHLKDYVYKDIENQLWYEKIIFVNWARENWVI